MLVKRSELSWRFSIQRDNFVTVEKAMSVSLLGNAPGSALLRINRSCSGPAFALGRRGFQRDHGATDDSISILRGPTRLSYNGAIFTRQVLAACSRSFVCSSICINFSACKNVSLETCGPTA